MKISMRTDPHALRGWWPACSRTSVVLALVLSLAVGGCAPLFVASGNQSDVKARLMLSSFGSAAYIPVVVPNSSWDEQELRSLAYDFYLGDRKVTEGKVDYDKPIDSRSELKVTVTIDLNETWLLKTNGFGRTGTAPYRLVGTAVVGDAEVPVSVDGRLWMPGMRPR